MKKLSVLAALVPVALIAADGAGPQGPPTLNVVWAGINSRGNELFDAVGVVRPAGRRFRIELESESDGPSLAAATGRGIQQFLDPDVSADVTIRVKDVNDPRLAAFINQVAAEPHATLNVDMDIVGLNRERWQEQAARAAQIVARVGDERSRTLPQSVNTVLAHSAGTVGLSKLIDSGKGDLFPTKIAASPMTRALSSDVVVVLAKGDLPSTPSGAVVDVQLFGAAARDPDGWTSRGNRVIRISGKEFDAPPTVIGAVRGPIVGFLARSPVSSVLVTAGRAAMSAVEAHVASPKLGVRDANVEVLVPVSSTRSGEPPSPQRVERFEVANVSAGNVVNALLAQAGPHSPTMDSRRTTFDALKKRIEQLKPPEGGGIKLGAAAVLPFAADRIARAVWDATNSRVLMHDVDGRQWTLPPIPESIVPTTYASVFAEPQVDIELSIGPGLKGTLDVPTAGHQPVSYAGGIDGTMVGLMLLKADQALADVAYGGSSSLRRRRLDALPGFHSLPELYPAKYTNRPGAENLIGAEERVVIESLSSRLQAGPNGTLSYAAVPEFGVRFGRSGPAERAFSDTFGAYYFEVIARVPEFRDLVECARAVAIFKWIRENGIRFDARAALGSKEAVFTPHQVPVVELPSLDDVNPAPPLVVYGEHGPTDVFADSKTPTRVFYAETGRVDRIVATSGRTLRVHVDDLGQPVAIEAANLAAVFERGDGDVPVMVDDVILRQSTAGITFERRPASVTRPVSEPWEVVETAARNFLRTGGVPELPPSSEPATPPNAPPPAGQTSPAGVKTPIVFAWIAAAAVVLAICFAIARTLRRRPPAV